VERNVREDPEALRALVDDHQSRSTPTLVVGDEVLIGFAETSYRRVLGLDEDR